MTNSLEVKAAIADYLNKKIDWQKCFSIVDTLGTTMNGHKDRFDKSDIIEMSLDAYSDGAVKYVNMIGVDHILTDLSITMEMKFSSVLFYKEFVTQRANKNQPKIKELRAINKPITVKLVNSMGTNTHTSLPSSYAEVLLVVDNYSAHVIMVSELIPYLKFGGDGIEAYKVPSELFYKIVGPEDVSGRKSLADFNYKEEKIKFQKDFLRKF